MMKKFILLIAGIVVLLGLLIIFIQNNRLIGLIYLFVGLLLFCYSRLFDRLKRVFHVVIRGLFALPLLMMLFLLIYGSNHTTDFTEDVVFVLGAGLRDDQILSTLRHRLNQAVVYFEQNPDVMFIVCGGYDDVNTISEARAMADFLISKGIPYEQIILEDASTSTYENLVFAVEILAEYFPDGFTSVLITNNFHIYRAGFLARYAGIEPNYFGARTPLSMWPSSFVREVLAVFNTWLVQTS